MSRESEKLYDGVTNIDDALIERAQEAKPKRRRFYRKWMGAVAAALAIAMLAGVLLRNPFGRSGTTVNASYVIAEAIYPEAPPYPTNENAPNFSEQYQAWFRNVRSRMDVRGADAVAAFGADAARHYLAGAGTENRVVSPLNVYLALAVLAELTDGESRAQILNLLRVEDVETLREQASELWNAGYRDDGVSASLLASSVWLSEDVNFVPKTMQTLADVYYASSYRGEMGSDGFNEALRTWLNENTGGLLEEQAADVELDAEALLALATTVYFRAKWAGEFRKESTAPGAFHAPDGDVTCEMMHGGADGYYWGERFSAVVRPFDAMMGAMYFILPDEGVSVDELLADDEALRFLQAPNGWENAAYPIIRLTLPRFDVVSDFDLSAGLKALGVTDVFDWQTADFTPMTRDMPAYVSKAEHAARVTVDEEGVVAAAYTVLAMSGGGMPPEDEIDFTLDRPFLFAVTGAQDLPLFVGVVNQP